jgi:large subunit ribosomal protein L17
MRHKLSGKKLNRDTNHRKALIKNLVNQMVMNEKLETTLVKAKVALRHVEKLVSKAKDNSLHSRRQLIATLSNEKSAHKLIEELAPRFADQTGGYIKLIRVARRRGDNTMVARLEFVKKNQPKPEAQKAVSEAK